jgi:hypothetical protein
MSMTWHEAQEEEAMAAMEAEIEARIYPEHRDRALGEFSDERLRSYYVKNRRVMCPAIQMMTEARKLMDEEHFAAAVVFYGVAIELLLKATILRPIVAGLVHIESFAELIMSHALARDGYAQYLKLLKQVFQDLAGIDLEQTRRPGISQTLWEECSKVRNLRNCVVHEGATRTKEEAELARSVALAVLSSFVYPVISNLGLTLSKDKTGELCDA